MERGDRRRVARRANAELTQFSSVSLGVTGVLMLAAIGLRGYRYRYRPAIARERAMTGAPGIRSWTFMTLRQALRRGQGTGRRLAGRALG